MKWLKDVFRVFLALSCLGVLFMLLGMQYPGNLPLLGYYASIVLAIPLLGLSLAVMVKKQDFVLGLLGFLIVVVQLMFVFSVF